MKHCSNACWRRLRTHPRNHAFGCILNGLALCFTAALRVGSLVALRYQDYSDERQELLVSTAKGNRPYRLPVGSRAQQALTQWIKIRGDDPGPLFCGIDRHGNLDLSRHLTSQGAQTILNKLSHTEAGDPDHITFHDLRGTALSDTIDTQGIKAARDLANHESIQTTAGYDRKPEERKKAAVLDLDNSLPE